MEYVITSYSPFTIEFHHCGKIITKHYDVALLPLEIMSEAEFVFVQPEPEPEPMYKLLVSTPKSTIQQTELTFEQAVITQRVLSLVVESLGWTRQPAIDSIVEHTGYILDMYAEGYIIVQPE